MKVPFFSFFSPSTMLPPGGPNRRKGNPHGTNRRSSRTAQLRRFVWIGLALGLCPWPSGSAHAQIDVKLELNKAAPQPIQIAVEWETSAGDRSKQGKLPGGIAIQMTRLEGEGRYYDLRLDSNADGSLDGETEHQLQPDQNLFLEIERRFSEQRSEWLPYTLSYKIFTDRKGNLREHFFLTPQYQAEGMIKLGSCSAKLVLLDLNGDGLFDQLDAKRGSNLGLDVDGNQKVHGREEWHRAGVPIHYCKKAFTVAIVENDGSKLVLNHSDAKPRLAPNTRLPLFNFETIDGKTIYSHHLNSKAHVFAFWATWSKQSLRNVMPLKQLKQEFGDKLAIIAVNVDKQPQMAQAKNMVRHQAGDWNNVIQGKGSKDPVWRNICDTTGAPNVVPYYVALDPKGFIHYQGTGGKKLARLRRMLYKLYPDKDPRFKPKDPKQTDEKKPNQTPRPRKKGS